LASESAKPQKRQRDKFVLDGQIEILGIVIANSLGMASFYWVSEAKRLSGLDERDYQ
jgi:hypothetical protein